MGGSLIELHLEHVFTFIKKLAEQDEKTMLSRIYLHEIN